MTYHPTVHMNGTSKKELLQQQIDVIEACRDLQEALRAASPNGRDYYTQSPGALGVAQREHLNSSRVVELICIPFQERAEALATDGVSS